jgi:hypothetical protein
MTSNQYKNQVMLRAILLPAIFLTVALLGGLRVSVESNALIFIKPSLITLILSLLLLILFIRGELLTLHQWINFNQSILDNISSALTLVTLFFASAQAFNSMLPERGLLHWIFSFFFLWTLWTNQFSLFDAKRLLRSLSVLFGTAFVLKHIVFASLYSPEGGWMKRIAGILLEGVSLGTLNIEPFAPSTGYISFFTLLLYVLGLIILSFSEVQLRSKVDELVHMYQALQSEDQRLFRQLVESRALEENEDTLIQK